MGPFFPVKEFLVISYIICDNMIKLSIKCRFFPLNMNSYFNLKLEGDGA